MPSKIHATNHAEIDHGGEKNLATGNRSHLRPHKGMQMQRIGSFVIGTHLLAGTVLMAQPGRMSAAV